MFIKHLDVQTAFLNAELDKDEHIYVKLPEPIRESDTVDVRKLQKALYGVRTASCHWFEKFAQSAKGRGMTQISDSPCIFISDDYDIILALYVDDILIASMIEGHLQQFVLKLAF